MIDIKEYRLSEFHRANIVNIDEELLSQCAYYPMPRAFGHASPCLFCTFDCPNESCKRSHILTDSRIKKIKIKTILRKPF
jgi:hypothetical protein